MSTFQDLVTGLGDELLAILALANFHEGLSSVLIPLLELLEAEPARDVVELITGLSQVVRLGPALGAEVLLALVAPEPMLGHVLGGLFGQKLPLLVFLTEVDLTLDELNDVAAVALEQVRTRLNELFGKVVLHFLPLKVSHILLELVILDSGLAARAAKVSILSSFRENSISQALSVGVVEAI